LESRDYGGRTPLHLAVQLERPLLVDYLIGLPNPANIRTQDDFGNEVISSMIASMPILVRKKFNFVVFHFKSFFTVYFKGKIS